MIPVAKIVPNETNPRLIKELNFERLCNSLKEFPEMMSLRPIVVDENNVILAGNMRFTALKHMGYSELPDEWVKVAKGLTEAQKREFIIKDNSSFGEYDWDKIANEWTDLPLVDWGVTEMKYFETTLEDFFAPNEKESDHGLERIILKYPHEEHDEILDFLKKIDKTFSGVGSFDGGTQLGTQIANDYLLSRWRRLAVDIFTTESLETRRGALL